ncbi:MAG: glycoside hydrolase family 127 protein, partial [Anaerolineae bacterium]|nr:glycoside hydrolase family 127 protein [Anaerolineae bacterium]
LILEPIVMLGQRTGDERFIKWGEDTLRMWDTWLEAHPESTHTCGYTAKKQFAAGEKDVWELRENIHAHTYHMTLLGVAALYNATGNPEYRDVVLGSVDRLAKEWIFLTGGMSSLERYVPRKYYHHRNQIEVCPQHTWILLLAQALEWTGEAHYAHEIERDLLNHFLAAQTSDGSNWSYFTPLNGRAREPSTPNCCNAAGHRIAGRMPTYLYGVRDNGPTVLMYGESDATLAPAGLPNIRLRQETTFPSSGEVTLYVDPETPAAFPLQLRIPPYAGQAAVTVNGKPAPVSGGEYAVLERSWQPGDVVKLSLPFDVTCQANEDVTAVVRGPLVYAYFQDAQRDTVVFHHRCGMYLRTSFWISTRRALPRASLKCLRKMGTWWGRSCAFPRTSGAGHQSLHSRMPTQRWTGAKQVPSCCIPSSTKARSAASMAFSLSITSRKGDLWPSSRSTRVIW